MPFLDENTGGADVGAAVCMARAASTAWPHFVVMVIGDGDVMLTPFMSSSAGGESRGCDGAVTPLASRNRSRASTLMWVAMTESLATSITMAAMTAGLFELA